MTTGTADPSAVSVRPHLLTQDTEEVPSEDPALPGSPPGAAASAATPWAVTPEASGLALLY